MDRSEGSSKPSTNQLRFHCPGDQRGIGGFPADLGNCELSRADAIDFEPIPCRRCLQNCIDGLRSGLGTWKKWWTHGDHVDSWPTG